MTAATEHTTEVDENTEVDNDQVLDTGDQPNPLDMSDEDFLKSATPPVAATSQVEKTQGKPAEGGDEDEDDEGGDGGEKTSQKPVAETAAGDGVKPEPKDGAGDKTTEAKPGEKTVDKPAATEPKKDAAGEKSPDPVQKPAEIDYAAAGKALLSSFKANGRDIRVDSVEDARALMQMGANYNKKMAALKPSLKVLKLLENNDLLSEEKLGFLIDLSKKDPQAINKLVKESGISPMEIDPEKAGEYRPTKQTVDDREMALDEVLDDIKESSSYTQTLSIAQKWDADSKKVIGDQPDLLRVINSHVESGVYALISAEVERERTFGRLQGLSDIAAYRQVGDAIQARGGFNHLFKPSATAAAEPGKASEAGKVVEPKPKKDEDESRNEKRRAMGTPKPAAPSGSTGKEGFNPLALSDDEFLKQATPKFR